MKFTISKSPILKKYGVFSANKELVIPFKYDYILDIVDEKWVIVAKESQFNIVTDGGNYINTTWWKKYSYGLIDLNNNKVLDMSYDLLWVKGDSIYVMNDNVVNKKNLSGQSIWHSKFGTIRLNNWILYQEPEFAIIEDIIKGGVVQKRKKIKVIDVNFNILEEAENFNYIKNKYIIKQIFSNYDSRINIFPGIGLWCSKEWIKFRFELNSEFKTNLCVKNCIFSDVVEYDFYNDEFLYIKTNTARSFIFNKKGDKIFESDQPVLIQKMVDIQERIVINGVFIIENNGSRYEMDIQCQHMASYEFGGNGYIKIIDKPQIFPCLNAFMTTYNYFGLMDGYGRLIAPIIFPSPKMENSESESYRYRRKDDLSDVFEGDSDAFWNIN